MLSIRSSADLARALASSLDAELKRLLIQHRDNVVDGQDIDLSELAFFVVAEPGDPAETIADALGFDPAVNPADGSRFGQVGFNPGWEWLERHDRWTELVFVLSDDGFGAVLFIPHRDDVDRSLTALCRAHA